MYVVHENNEAITECTSEVYETIIFIYSFAYEEMLNGTSLC